MTKNRITLPTLTEVIEVQADRLDVDTGPAPLPPESVPMELLPTTPVDAASATTAEVLEMLRPRVDALLEACVREALATQELVLADETTQRVHGDFAGALQALIAHAVDDVLARRHKP